MKTIIQREKISASFAMERLTTCWQSVRNRMFITLECGCVRSWLTVQTSYLHSIRTIFLAKNKLSERLSTWGNLLLLFLRNFRMKRKNFPPYGHHLCLLINGAILHENNGFFFQWQQLVHLSQRQYLLHNGF